MNSFILISIAKTSIWAIYFEVITVEHYSGPALRSKKAATRQVLTSERCGGYMSFKCPGALLWTNWNGTVIQGEMQRVPVDLTEIICLCMKATKETSKGREHIPIKYRYFNIDVDILVSLSGSVIILHVISS